jgi:hypothetical protein
MRRFRRWIFNLVAALSLILCVGLTALSISGYYIFGWQGVWEIPHSDGFGLSRFEVDFSGGGIEIIEQIWTVDPKVRTPNFTRFYLSTPNSPLERSWRRTFATDYPHFGPPARWDLNWNTVVIGWSIAKNHGLIVPAWFPIILLLIPPGLFLFFRLRKHSTPGVCAQCGYDLRATPDRCPECGTIPPPPRATSN